MIQLKVTVLTLVLIVLLIYSQTPYTQEMEIKSPVIGFAGQVDSIVINKMNQYNIPGLSLGLVKNGVVIYARGFGVKSIDSVDPVTKNTIFHTASISKMFTAIAIMQLEKNGSLSLDDRLVHVIPEIKYSDPRVEEITIKEVLNHTSGLPDIDDYQWDNNNQSDSSLKNYILGLDLELNSEPSTTYSYSNLGYNILGYIIEKKAGCTFDDYLKENILNKSGMHASDFRYFKITDSLRSSPHTKSRITGSVYERETYPYTREHASSSTLNASAEDLCNWMISFLQTLEEGGNNEYSIMLEPTFSDYPQIGLGFQLSTIGSKKVVGHYGGDKGFRSYLMMIPEEKIGLVILANCDYDEDFRQEVLHQVAELMLKHNKVS